MEHIYRMLLDGLYLEEIAKERKINVEDIKQEIEYWTKRSTKLISLNEFLQFISDTQKIDFNIITKIIADCKDRKGFPIGYMDKLFMDYCSNNYYIAAFVIRKLERNRL